MSSRLGFLVLSSLNLVLAQSGSTPIINTPPSVVQCLPTMLTFGGGTAPYTITAIPAGQTGAAPIADLGTATGTQKTWVTNVPAGTAITLMIRDSTGAINYSQAVTVQNGNDSCMNGAGGSSSGSGSTPTPTSPPSPVTTGVVPSPGSNNSTPPPGGSQNKTPPGNTPASPPNNAGGSNSTTPTKGPSPFVPSPTNGSVSSNSPAANAANSAASSVLPVNLWDCFLGLSIAGSALAVFA